MSNPVFRTGPGRGFALSHFKMEAHLPDLRNFLVLSNRQRVYTTLTAHTGRCYFTLLSKGVCGFCPG